jgi:hypothetical protein
MMGWGAALALFGGMLAGAGALAPPASAAHSCTQITSEKCAFSFTGAPESFTVPAGVTDVTIDAAGAQGGAGDTRAPGGLGARLGADFTVTPGETLYVVVGGEGASSLNAAGGGGGGSFVYTSATSTGLLLAAAGGGGAAGPSAGINASATTTASDGEGQYPFFGGLAGTNGDGGGAGMEGAGGGGGLLSNGGDVALPPATGGRALANGAAGGSGHISNGGFGGGGGTSSVDSGGGGGGYNGGGGGATPPQFNAGGGGGSFSATTPSISHSGAQTGNGEVIIKLHPAKPA